eukprot:2355990-Rhodomonas_salina.3
MRPESGVLLPVFQHDPLRLDHHLRSLANVNASWEREEELSNQNQDHDTEPANADRDRPETQQLASHLEGSRKQQRRFPEHGEHGECGSEQVLNREVQLVVCMRVEPWNRCPHARVQAPRPDVGEIGHDVMGQAERKSPPSRARARVVQHELRGHGRAQLLRDIKLGREPAALAVDGQVWVNDVVVERHRGVLPPACQLVDSRLDARVQGGRNKLGAVQHIEVDV